MWWYEDTIVPHEEQPGPLTRAVKIAGWITFVLGGLMLLLSLSGCRFPGPVDPNVDPRKGAELLLIVLDDANTRTGETGAILHNDQYWQGIKAKGHQYKFLQATNEAAKPFLSAAEKCGQPALLIYRAKDLKLLAAEKLPPETKRIDDLVLKYGGKRERGPPKYVGLSGELVSEPDIYIDSEGYVRRLGVIPSDEKVKSRRKELPGLGEFLRKKGVSLIPAEKWVEIDYPRFHKPEFVLDQRNTSGCVGFSAAAANMKIRALRGMTPERLSGAFVYSLINGGNDGGAMIDDSRIALTKYGVCLDSENPLPKIFWRQVGDEAKQSALRRQMTVAYRCDNINEVATALQLGLIVQAGVQVDGNFSSFDNNGISRARGRYANHSIHLYGMKQIDGKWVYRMGNTWGATWGPFRDGSCYLRPEGIVIEGDAFVHADSEWKPEDLPTPRQKMNQTSQIHTKGKLDADRQHAQANDTRFVLAQ